MAPRECGLFVILVNDEPRRRAPLKSIDVVATVCGPIAHNTIKFQYKNTNDTAIQSKFIFPVNSQSCIYHLSADVGGRKIVGKVKEKEAAQKEYDEAVESGKSAVLAKESKEASDIVELDLGAFGADEEAEVMIKEVFEMKLVKSGAQFQYKFPTSLFVRYGDTITASASQNSPTEYVLNFQINSFSGVAKITPKPWLGSETAGNTFSFQGNRKVFEKDHDVVLDLILAEDFKGVKLTENWQDLTIIDPDDRKTDKRLMLSSFLIRVPSTPISELPAKEYVFVVDCSGSMNGNRIVSARETLQLLINSLPIGSYFNIVRFGDKYESLFRQPKEYTKENKEIAMKLAETMSADLGGTQLFECLKSVVGCKRHIVNFKRQVFVLTDGGISNQDATLRLVTENAKENRFFSFGIGSGCSTALVNGLADAGMGSASFITDKSTFEWEKQENLSSICVKSLMASASQHIAAVKITPEPKAPKEPVSMVVDSTCLNVFHEELPETVSLELTLANNKEEHVVTKQDMDNIETIESPFESNVLHKLAAKKIIAEMVISNLSNPYGGGQIQEIIDLSVKEQVLSPYTALVGVADESAVVGISQRVDVGHSLDFNSSFICTVGVDRCISGGFGGGQERFRAFSQPYQACSSPSRSAYFSAPKKKQSGYRGASAKSIDSPKKGTKSFMRSILDSASEQISRLMPASRSRQSQTMCEATMACAAPPKSIITIDTVDDIQDCLDECCMEDTGCRDSMDSMDEYELQKELEDLENEQSSCSRNAPKEVTTYQNITNEQNPGGEWTIKLKSEHEDNLFKNIEERIDDHIVQFTVYAILLLLVDFSDTFDEWKLTASKGINFLKKSISDLEGEMSKLLSISHLEIDDDMLSQLLE